MKENELDFGLGASQHGGLKYGTASPGYRAVRQAIVNIVVEKMTNSTIVKESDITTKTGK